MAGANHEPHEAGSYFFELLGIYEEMQAPTADPAPPPTDRRIAVPSLASENR